MVRFPPQGVGAALPLKQSFANAVIGLSSDARDCMGMEVLVSEGRLTIDQVATYVEAVGTADFWAGVLSAWSTSFSAKVLNSTSLSTSKAASIILSPKIPASVVIDVLKDASISADRAQAILYACAMSSKLVEILTYGAGDLFIAAATSISGTVRYDDFEIASGITVTTASTTVVIICRRFKNNGTLSANAQGASGGAPGGTGGGTGGKGGGGLIIFTDVLENPSTISSNGANGGDGATTSSKASGYAGGAGAFLYISGDTIGTGGAGGNTPDGHINGGGGGGYGATTGQGGAGGDSTRTSVADYPILAETIKKAVIDWVMVNVWGKTPTTTTSFPSFYGSGGGGGGVYDANCCGGGGGGGGGEITILCVSLNNTGTISANGGNGGNGGIEGTLDSGGGGGGGGLVYALYKTLVNTGTLSASGGAGGSGDKPGSAGGNGTAKAVAV